MEMLVVYSIFLPLQAEGAFLKRDIVLFFPKTLLFVNKTIFGVETLTITVRESTAQSSGVLWWVLLGEPA